MLFNINEIWWCFFDVFLGSHSSLPFNSASRRMKQPPLNFPISRILQDFCEILYVCYPHSTMKNILLISRVKMEKKSLWTMKRIKSWRVKSRFGSKNYICFKLLACALEGKFFSGYNQKPRKWVVKVGQIRIEKKCFWNTNKVKS